MDLLLYGVIGDEWDGLDAKTLVLAISQAEGELNLRINSPGGFVTEGLAIYGAVMRARAAGVKVTCFVDGIAASMASVIAMAGDEIVMAENALMMIQKPSTFGISSLKPAEIRHFGPVWRAFSLPAPQTARDAETRRNPPMFKTARPRRDARSDA